LKNAQYEEWCCFFRNSSLCFYRGESGTRPHWIMIWSS
jgi:hypothetical protein